MRVFFIQHIDAIITTTLGLCATAYAWRQHQRLQTNPNWLVRNLPILAPLIVVFGLLRFIPVSQPEIIWQRVFTSDQKASAEFPKSTTTETTTDSGLGFNIERQTINCDIPRRGINLRLSYNEIPQQAAELDNTQFINDICRYFELQGCTIVSNMPNKQMDIPGYRLIMEKDHGKTMCMMQITLTPHALYRAVATSTSGFHGDPIINQFLDSFRLH